MSLVYMCPSRPRPLVSWARQLSEMKPGSHLVNASRATVVDIDALADALRRFDNAILTPHIGDSTREAQVNIGIEVATKLVRYSSNGFTISAVNFPEVALPVLASGKHLLHIHKNTLGVLAKLNALLSENGINIAAQYLETNNEIGYVVVDVSHADQMPSTWEVCSVGGAMRCRVV